ncbi:energy transducer TonB [Rudaea cellulosilytica]|uniref:energy transducer TonB n=1 Tax=Rudaea cellulosilytica TaxID=540746 RepID=UPI000A05611F|nr:energy transducer TonB [Rudaea cellulosilytica]
MTLRPTRLAQPPARAGTGLSAMRASYGIGLSRSATAIALLLSLLLHVAFILALLRPEPAPQAIARVDVVSVHLVPTQPAATAAASEPPLPPAPSTAKSAEQAEEVHRQGDTAPPSEPNVQRMNVRRAASAKRLLPNKADVLPQPAPKADAAAPTPHLDESPENRAANSLSDYLRLLAMRLAEVKQYPAAAVAQHEQGEVLVGFRLDHSGHVLSWQIARSSGYDELDAEVARMVERAAPFPPLPRAWHADSASFQVPIGFSLY